MPFTANRPRRGDHRDVPTWAEYDRAHDQTSSYRYMKKVLQCCQWQRGGMRWVLKSPQHLEQFPVLLDVFPTPPSW